jgi:hypothetical protein
LFIYLFLFFAVLDMEPRASYILVGKHSTTESQAPVPKGWI